MTFLMPAAMPALTGAGVAAGGFSAAATGGSLISMGGTAYGAAGLGSALTAGNVAMGLSGVSSILSAGSQYNAGKAEERRANLEAQQLDASAKEELAAAQRAGVEEERMGEFRASRMLALAAASGAGASDPTVINLMANLAGETQYSKSVKLYEGGTRSAQKKYEGRLRRFEGREARKAGEFGAKTTLLGGAAGLFSKYGFK